MDFDAAPNRKLLPLQLAAPDIEAWLLERDPVAIDGWNTIGREEYARAFTAARTAGADVVDDLYLAILDTVARGGTEQSFVDLVTPTLRRKGWLGGDNGEIANRVRLIYDTNLRLARASGRWSSYQRSKDALPYLLAFTVGDERVRHPPKSPHADHRAWDGILLPVDHWWWRTYWPPLGFRCRCDVRQLTRSAFARYRGGITSDEELRQRAARIGDPVFLPPNAPIGAQLATMVAATNDGRMPGAPTINPRETEKEGLDAWDAVMRAKSLDDLTSRLNSMFGRAA